MTTLKKYTTYHQYLEKNWNKTVANYIIKTEQKGEEKFGIDSTGIDRLKKMSKLGIDTTHAHLYMPVPYNLLKVFFKVLDLSKCKHLLDLGCGKGRALCVAAHYGVEKITGIDFSNDLILAAQNNVGLVKHSFPKTKFYLLHNDAFYYKIPKDVDCIFMFNPFDETIMSGVLHNIEQSLKQYPRSISIIYINPIYKDLFLAYGYKENFHYQKMTYLEGVILSKEARFP